MPRYERECKACEFFKEQIEKISAARTIICPKCGEKKFKKVISKVNFQIKGAQARDGYASIPTNEELGLTPMREARKQQEDEDYIQILQKGGNLSPQEREAIKDQKKQVKEHKNQEDRRIGVLKDKHKEFSDKLNKSMKEAKEKPRHYRNESKEKRKKEGNLGTKLPKKELPKLI